MCYSIIRRLFHIFSDIIEQFAIQRGIRLQGINISRIWLSDKNATLTR